VYFKSTSDEEQLVISLFVATVTRKEASIKGWRDLASKVIYDEGQNNK
jgi:hypothetical protein